MNRDFGMWFFLFAIALAFSAFFHRGEAIKSVIWSDAEGYYIYLPALLIHNGFEQTPFINGCTRIVGPDQKERTFTKYTYGVALLQSPFVVVGHLLAPKLGYAQDGASAPYAWSILIAAIFYMLTGLFLLKSWLSHWFSNNLIGWILALIFLGTNLFYYTVREAGMSHVYSFFLFGVFLRSSQLVRQSRTVWYVPMAISFAVIVLIRPTNALVAIAPLFVGSSIVGEFHLWRKKWIQLLFFVPVVAIIFLPQLLYWYHTTGSYFWYSYGDEGFSNWSSPKILSVLFSHQNGLFLYTPLMVFIAWGMLLQLQQKAVGRWLNPAILLIATYVFASWWAWWFGGAFGHRCYVEYYSIMTLPLGFALVKLSNAEKWFQRIAIASLVAIVFLNIRLTQIYGGVWDGPDWEFVDYADKVLRAFFLR